MDSLVHDGFRPDRRNDDALPAGAAEARVDEDDDREEQHTLSCRNVSSMGGIILIGISRCPNPKAT